MIVADTDRGRMPETPFSLNAVCRGCVKMTSHNNSIIRNSFLRKRPAFKSGALALIVVIVAVISLSNTNMTAVSSAEEYVTIYDTTYDTPGTGWKKTFGNESDSISMVAATDDGFVIVGSSGPSSFGTGDWAGVEGKGDQDAIIVKFDADGNVIWKKNFGGASKDGFSSVAVTGSGFVAVGISDFDSFGTGDWASVGGKGDWDAIIVKFDTNGNVVWKKNFGGEAGNSFIAVAESSDGFIAVGSTWETSFGNGDWASVEGKGNRDAIIVKFDTNGNVVWKKNFGGSDDDSFSSVVVSDDSYVVVGGSFRFSMDLKEDHGDALIVKYDKNGNVIWEKIFGGRDSDGFSSVVVSDDSYVVVGYSSSGSFGNGDWTGVAKKGNIAATMVKFDTNGNVVWKKNFGGNGYMSFGKVVTDGANFVAVGDIISGYGRGDWKGIAGKGGTDAFIVKFDTNGNVTLKKIIGGKGADQHWSVAAVEGGYVSVGYSSDYSSGDWKDLTEKDNFAPFIVKLGMGFGIDFVPVKNITLVSASATVGETLALNGTTAPSDVTNKTITWIIKSAGTTGAVINGNELFATSTGKVVVTAVVADGVAPGTPFEKDFTITVRAVGEGSDIWLIAGIVVAVLAVLAGAAFFLLRKRAKEV